MQTPLAGKQLIDLAVQSAFDKKAENIVVIDLTGRAGMADWFVICQGDNAIHNTAIADGIRDELERHGTSAWHVEGHEQGRWVLLDYSDIVVHIMLPELRKYYQLEQLFPDSPSETMVDKASIQHNPTRRKPRAGKKK